MTKPPPYITIDANGRISRAQPPRRKRPKRELKLAAFVIFIALCLALYFEVSVSILRLIF